MNLKRIAAVSFAVCVLFSLPVTLSAANPGSSEDPLVTYSYITGTFKRELKAEILSEIETTKGQASGYIVERLSKGQSLYALDACEIILRSGGAVVFVEDEDNIQAGLGLSDCTGGTELKNGEPIPKQHLLIIPRGDGRGVTVNTDEAYIMVRGLFEVKEPAG